MPASRCTTARRSPSLITRDGRVYGVHATTPDGRLVDVGAQLVIGADGIRSTVAQRVGAPLTRVGTARDRDDVRLLVRTSSRTVTSGSSVRTRARA